MADDSKKMVQEILAYHAKESGCKTEDIEHKVDKYGAIHVRRKDASKN